MIKKILIIVFFVIGLSSCADLQHFVNNLPQGNIGVSQTDIANGLKQALNQGVEEQVSLLTKQNGFYEDLSVKIFLPEELQKVEKGLRDFGLGDLADKGIKALNRAAEDAVKEATPIFVNAIQEMTFVDAKNILLGEENAATIYLEDKTKEQLYKKFQPVINNSFSKVGAAQLWTTIISQYNNLPLVESVNPDLTDYVTKKALDGVFSKIAVEEKNIRNSYASRTTDLLKKVFALQDKNNNTLPTNTKD